MFQKGRNPKAEGRTANNWWGRQFRISSFGLLSDFGFRISAFLLLMMTDPLSGFSAPTPAQKTNSAAFRAGAASSNITPRLGVSINGYFNDRKAVHIHDELHARCLALDNG